MFDGVHRANNTPLPEAEARIFCSVAMSISGRLAPCACNRSVPVLRDRNAIPMHQALVAARAASPASDASATRCPKRVSDLAYADIRARRMRQCMRRV